MSLLSLAAALVDAFENTEPVFLPGTDDAVFVSTRDGLPQLYRASALDPEAPASRLAAFPERMTSPVPTPDGRSVLFQSDHGGDELWSVYRLDLADHEVDRLTTGPALNLDPPMIPREAPDTFYASGRSFEAPASTIYTGSVSVPGPPVAVYRDDGAGFLRDVSPDGDRALFVRFRTMSESELVVVDLHTGDARPIFGSSTPAAVFDAAFSTDGQTALVATDGGGEQALVVAIDVDSGQQTARHVETAPATARIETITVAPAGGLVALSLDAGNRSEVRLLDAETLAPRAPVTLPLGSGEIGAFSPDGSRLAVVWSTPAGPADVQIVDPATGTVGPMRREARPTLAGLPDVRSEIVVIPGFDGTPIPMNVHLPVGLDSRLPVIVRFHGGPAGSSAIGWSSITRFFLACGYAVVEPNIRGSGGFGPAFQAADDGPRRPDSFRDVETVARWAGAQPWADPERRIAYGSSYGGYLVLVALTRQPELWSAGVDLYGLADLTTFMASTSGLVRQNYLTELGDPEADAAFLRSISPLQHADDIRRPLFVYAGRNDPRVPVAQSDRIVEALRRRRVPVDYLLAEDEGHGLSRRENQLAFCVRAARFLNRQGATRHRRKAVEHSSRTTVSGAASNEANTNSSTSTR